MGGARKIFNHSTIKRGSVFMKLLKLTAFIVLIAVISLSLTGCGVSKNKYEALLNEKMALDEKLNMLTKSRDALRGEYENLLKDKMDLASRVETLTNEKSALKGEYDKLLDEKVSLKAAYNKVSEPKEIKEAQVKAVKN
jgi:predicted nuclease with TOPRIM domain